MDVFDQATELEEKQREAAIEEACRVKKNDPIAEKRKKLAEARLIAAQRGADDPEVQELGLTCQNGCGEPLTVENEDIFCCVECAIDWQRIERARQINGRTV